MPEPEEHNQDDLNAEYDAEWGEKEAVDLDDEPESDADDDLGESAEAEDHDLDSTDDEPLDPKEEQRRKSWEGRIKAEERRIAEERQRLEQEKAEIEAKKPKAAEPQKTTDDDATPDFSDVEGDFPELVNHLKKTNERVERERQERERLQQQIAEREQQEAQRAQQQHKQSILTAHPDAYDLVEKGEVQAWLDDLPYREARDYERVMQSGSADEVVTMLNQFKASKTKQPGNSPNKDRARQAQSMAAVKSSTVVARPRGKPDPNDYDAAWDEDD